MKNPTLLKQIIKEEIKKVLNEAESSEVTKLTSYLSGAGKTALSQINTPEELDGILNAVFAGMNPGFQKNAKAQAIKKVIDMKL